MAREMFRPFLRVRRRASRVLKDVRERFQPGKKLSFMLVNHSQDTIKARVKLAYDDDTYTDNNLTLSPMKREEIKLSVSSKDVYRLGFTFSGMTGPAKLGIGDIKFE